jgi:hypothetical protein
METVQISDVVIPTEFTAYVVENSVELSALVQSGIVTRNAAIDANLKAGAESFNVPYWTDLSNDEADIASDDPAVLAITRKLAAGKQIVRKSFLHASWSAMNLASELSGSNALVRIQSRVAAYWMRQAQRRLVATLNGVLADNVSNWSGDMIYDGSSASFSAAAVISAANTLGDHMRDLTAIAMHSKIYTRALQNDLITTLPDSKGGFIQTFRGLGILVDDALPVDSTGEIFTSVLFGSGAIGYGTSAPRVAAGTEVHSVPAAGNGGGMQILHSRINFSLHPIGYQWKEASVAEDSPSIAELALPENWARVATDRRAVPLAFLLTKS